MQKTARITSILNANSLDSSITGLPSFHLSELKVPPATDWEFQLPDNVRLGHLAEKIVAQLIQVSKNYRLLHENSQIIEAKTTIGELDFILQDEKTKQIIHLELAYKFYLLDPTISSQNINNWIGPNRNDSLIEKLVKIKSKQFPLLHHRATKTVFKHLPIDQISQALCLLVSLFIPYQYKHKLNPSYEKAIKGYYLNRASFLGLNHTTKKYHIPTKKEWGIDPSENKIWTNLAGIQEQLNTCMKEKQAPLCWQKQGNVYEAFFIVWR